MSFSFSESTLIDGYLSKGTPKIFNGDKYVKDAKTRSFITRVESGLMRVFRSKRPRLDAVYSDNGVLLGQGCNGTVSMYTHRKSGEKVAVKKLPQHTTSGCRIDRIKTEIKIMNMAEEHPNIAPIISTHKDHENYYIVMPAYSTNLLKYAADQGGLELRIQMMNELVSAVKHLHAMDIAHCDIKLENVCVDDNMHIQLIDFGSAVYARDHVYGSRGSDPYIAPEAHDGPYDAKQADVWSVGAVWLCLIVRAFLWNRAVMTDKGYAAFATNRSRIWKGVEDSSEYEKFRVLQLLQIGSRRF